MHSFITAYISENTIFYILQKVSDILKMSNSLKVWSKFSVKKKDGTVLNLKIMDMPKCLSGRVVNLYIDHFVKEENTFKAIGK